MRQESFSDSVRIISVRRDEVIARLREVAGQIRSARPEVKEVRIFGSIARGDQTGLSDADVLIVLRGHNGDDPLERIRAFYPYFDLPIGVDLLVYHEGEIARRLQEGDGFMHQVWAESVRLDV
jgi:predicted nucleotidyltransferase